MEQNSRIIKSNELKGWCRSLVRELDKKTLILLFGGLGAGKTFFVQTFIEVLGGQGVSSPTYSLINSYRTERFKKIYHLDLYRLSGSEDLESTGFWDIFDNEEALVFVEWADRLKLSDFSPHWKKIKISIDYEKNKESRRYTYTEWTDSA